GPRPAAPWGGSFDLLVASGQRSAAARGRACRAPSRVPAAVTLGGRAARQLAAAARQRLALRAIVSRGCARVVHRSGAVGPCGRVGTAAGGALRSFARLVQPAAVPVPAG